MIDFIKEVLKNQPNDWLRLTTHRLDIYNEELAKSEFLEQLEALYTKGTASESELGNLPTAYDYIRLGHPLSSVLEWIIAKKNSLPAANVISFASQTMPILAILRKNLLANIKTRICYRDSLLEHFDAALVRKVYGYNFELQQVASLDDLPAFNGSTVLIDDKDHIGEFNLVSGVDFIINTHGDLGSILLALDPSAQDYVAEIQHVRRRESIAMTPADCNQVLHNLVGLPYSTHEYDVSANQASVISTIKDIVELDTNALVASSGLSIQYAIMMGLIDDAQQAHPLKAIKVIVPPNCYGGTNDQARRVAACSDNVEVMDLPVDGGNDMAQGVERVLAQVAALDAVPLIIAEIPTNPRVEVPDLEKLKAALTQERLTPNGNLATAPVFILDQTFCPNVHFLRDNDILAGVQTIAYISGSKFPSGGKCTAGYCVANKKAAHLMAKIGLHLQLCDNQATPLQMELLAEQMPSMNQRIADAYKNTREFVNFIQEKLPDAKINFVSEELASQGFTPSVFSLDLPTKGDTHAEREEYKRALNLKLINMMITEIPEESKYCVSYGQLKGCYWTIPATSTQGTTKEADKDYIARVAVSGDLDLERHKQVFQRFVEGL
ncbi:PLP-dependent transferase [Kangiella sp. TOML190]|uniref:PLP-dependent transferase n=1 Tax=Kangiella sp. TOML190 TaxID=2931351 RepID=UPI00203CFCA6|nr:PLP-dependent transferase [Kangiella sp. TOML190]